jgi:hypothetical protein
VRFDEGFEGLDVAGLDLEDDLVVALAGGLLLGRGLHVALHRGHPAAPAKREPVERFGAKGEGRGWNHRRLDADAAAGFT